MKITFVPFLNYEKKCRVKKVSYLEKCGHCGESLLMCRKYGGFCMASKCREDRRIVQCNDLAFIDDPIDIEEERREAERYEKEC